MKDRISISRQGDEGSFNEETLEVVPGADATLYTGVAMLGTAQPGDSAAQGYPANLYTHTCRLPLAASVPPVPHGAVVTVLSMDRPELAIMEGQQFMVETEVMGSYSASRMLLLSRYEAIRA